MLEPMIDVVLSTALLIAGSMALLKVRPKTKRLRDVWTSIVIAGERKVASLGW